jgi:hypothetical protein
LHVTPFRTVYYRDLGSFGHFTFLIFSWSISTFEGCSMPRQHSGFGRRGVVAVAAAG